MSGGYRVYASTFRFGLWAFRCGFRFGFQVPVSESVLDALSRSGVGFGTRAIWFVLPVAGYSCFR